MRNELGVTLLGWRREWSKRKGWWHRALRYKYNGGMDPSFLVSRLNKIFNSKGNLTWVPLPRL